MSQADLLLLGCGILRDEVNLLAAKNNWPLERRYLNSLLHCDLGMLGRSLTLALENHRGRDIVVFYGCCHPRMEDILQEARTFRTEGQNCISMLLGDELFHRELADGAYFLLEDWAKNWTPNLIRAFGTEDLDVIREIFQDDRKYLLCLRTPCSGDFTAAAVEAGHSVGLPLRWMDIGLDHLEHVLQEAVSRKLREVGSRP